MNKLLLTAAILAASSSALAGTMSTPSVVTVSTGKFLETQSFDSGLQGVNYSEGIAFALFNDQSGTLTLDGVTLTLASTVTGSVKIQNSGASAASFTDAFSSLPVSITGPGGLNMTVNAKAYATNGSVNPAQSYVIPAGLYGPNPIHVTANGEFKQSGLSGTLTETGAASSLGAYTGLTTGMLTMSTGAGSFGGTSAASLFFGGSASSDTIATLTYTYHTKPSVPNDTSPVPEASGYTFVALGMGLVGLLARRRKI